MKLPKDSFGLMTDFIWMLHILAQNQSKEVFDLVLRWKVLHVSQCTSEQRSLRPPVDVCLRHALL